MRILSQNPFLKLAAFAGFAAILLAVSSTMVKSNDFSKLNDLTVVQTRSGITIPAGAMGVVQINHATEGQLLHLRGIAGKGKIVLRSKEAGYCLSTKTEFVAGDFGGTHVGIRPMGPILIAIQSSNAAQTLLDGDEIISEEVTVANDLTNKSADIVLISGVGLSQGFVIDPKISLYENLFGVGYSKVKCEAL